MSVFNLVGSMCQPQYPTRFLVHYRGPKAPEEPSMDNDEIRLLPLKEVNAEHQVESELWTEPELGGTVGEAYGDLSETTGYTTMFMVSMCPVRNDGANLPRLSTTLSCWCLRSRRMLLSGR